jgi:predicted cupin superfamily sugar epimerase
MYSIAREDAKHTMTADEVKKILGLTPHPREGGFYIRTYDSGELLPATVFPDGRYSGLRHTATAIYYFLEPGTFSEMHRLQSDEIFHFYAGDAVEMLQLHGHGSGTAIQIGNRLQDGERPQVVAPRGVWQGSHLAPGGRWALLGCTVSPGFDFDDYEAASRRDLVAGWPEFQKLIEELTRPDQPE